MSEPTHPRTTGALEEIGLYNLLNRVARGQQDIDLFVLTALRQRGFLDADRLALSESGRDELKRLAVCLGWFYPDT
ncbi:MAG TPA: hypothetical protein VLM17_04955 [Xanthomonadaceae bacterium]|nr:hypothetical protein [Xanthomonadaceae bacterium]